MHMSNHIFLIITKLYLIVSYLIIVFQNANWNLKNILADNQWKSLLLIKWANPDYFFIPRTNALLYKKTRFETYTNNIKPPRWGTLQALLWFYCWFQFASNQAVRPHRRMSWKLFTVRAFLSKSLTITKFQFELFML